MLDSVEGLGFRVRQYHPVLDAVEGLGMRVWDSTDRGEGLGFRVWDSTHRGEGLVFTDYGLWIMVYGLGFGIHRIEVFFWLSMAIWLNESDSWLDRAAEEHHLRPSDSRLRVWG